jgi:hypothetical protein
MVESEGSAIAFVLNNEVLFFTWAEWKAGKTGQFNVFAGQPCYNIECSGTW